METFYESVSRRTKSEIDEQEKLREDIKRSEQKRRDKEKREAERLKFTEKTYSNLNKKSDVHQVKIPIKIFYDKNSKILEKFFLAREKETT